MIQLSLLFSTCLYLLLSHRFCVSLLPSRRFNHLYAVPPPSSEGGEAALCAAVRAQLPLCAPSVKTCRHIPHHNYSLLNISIFIKTKKRLFGALFTVSFHSRIPQGIRRGQFHCGRFRGRGKNRIFGKLTERAGNSPL